MLLICCVFGGIHLLITRYLSFGFRRYASVKNEIQPKISIIIAAHNELENLKRLIPKLLDQDYPDFEIIVSLDRTNDLSLEYLQTLEEKVRVIDIQKVPSDWNSKKYALNEAIKSASFDWLAFTDADCLPASNSWLNEISGNIKDGIQIVLGISPYQPDGSFLSQYVSFESIMTAFVYIGRALMKKPYMAVGRNLLVKKQLFLESRGYEAVKGVKGGDDDLFIQKNANASNTAVALGFNSLMQTFPEKTWKKYFNQKVRHLSVGSRYRTADQLFLSLFHISHLGFILSFIWLAQQSIGWVILLFYLFIKFVSYRFAMSKIGFHINYMWLPIVDMLYALLVPITAMWSKLVKDIQWKN